MAHIPKSVLEKQLPIPGLNLRNRGKVRDTYDLPGHSDRILVVASKRCSIFDFVLPTEIEQKGEVLTALSHFQDTKVLSPFFKTDLIASGAGIDAYLPPEHRGNVDLQKTAMVVKCLSSPEIEDIVRFHLTGSGYSDYKKYGIVCGHRLPPGLIDGSKLPTPLYTPSTKAKVGHDENISADAVVEKYGFQRERMMLMAFGMLAQYALSRGIIIADGKMEAVGDVLIDEKGTFDCCRFWDKVAFEKAHAKGKLPPSLDKQFVRDWGKRAFVDQDQTGRKRKPENPNDLVYIDGLTVDDVVRRMTTQLCRYIFWRLTGRKIEGYQRTDMGIAVGDRRPLIEILVGSESDLSQFGNGLSIFNGRTEYHVSVVSCHRNPDILAAMAENRLKKAGAVIAGAGMAAALPGVIKGLLCALGRSDIPVIGVAFKGKTPREDNAARLSIEELPGSPIELDSKGSAYFGTEGFAQACQSALEDEFLPRNIESKPAKLDVINSSQ